MFVGLLRFSVRAVALEFAREFGDFSIVDFPLRDLPRPVELRLFLLGGF